MATKVMILAITGLCDAAHHCAYSFATVILTLAIRIYYYLRVPTQLGSIPHAVMLVGLALRVPLHVTSPQTAHSHSSLFNLSMAALKYLF